MKNYLKIVMRGLLKEKLYLIFIILFVVVLLCLLLKVGTVNDSGWIEETPELKALQHNIEAKGYYTEKDFREIERIQDEQLKKKINESKSK